MNNTRGYHFFFFLDEFENLMKTTRKMTSILYVYAELYKIQDNYN